VKEDKQSNVISHNDYCKPLFDIDETAEILNISPHTVRALVKTRKITFVKLGARVLFRPQDLTDFVESHLVRTQAGPRGTVS
jgi:excisionase family DNA binding protein